MARRGPTESTSPITGERRLTPAVIDKGRARPYAWACGLALFALSVPPIACAAARPPTRAAASATPQAAVHARHPNILLIVADDLGQADLGSFGGEIATPHLDRLAYAGVRFTALHAAPACSPSRAMLLTGVDAHRAGLGNLAEELAPNQKGRPGYEGELNDRVVTLATRLKSAGYRTYMTGKWHLGATPASVPAARGFDRSFLLASGGASHFADMRPAYAPTPQSKANYWEDGRRLGALPAGFHYSSQFYVDRLIEYLDADRDTPDPFFAYLAFTAPHWPLQAPDAAIARQAGRYDGGYDELARRRLERQKQLGIVPAEAQLAERAPRGRPWTSLDTDERRVAARAMEIYAAMVEELDHHTGRLLDYLERRGLLNDTIVVFISDNGAEGHDLDETWPAAMFPDIRRTIESTHDFSFERMGRPGSYTLYGPDWARAGAPAMRLYKGFPTEGGIRVAAFMHYPRALPQARLVGWDASLRDIAPTLLDFAGVPWQGAGYSDARIEPITGRSLLPLLRGQDRAPPQRVSGVELMGKYAIRVGSWKLLHMPGPYGNDTWQLYDLATDLAESRDLAAEHPDKVAELRRHWESYVRENQVILPDWVSGY
ncbi:MAG: arylsulfatase [Gammaproteobacteria bacterium]|nr:arylsulfatase [Gammaproteobacteria bacterium]